MGIKASPRTLRTALAVDPAHDHRTFLGPGIQALIKAEKDAENAKANRKEAEAEGQRYAGGGTVKTRRGYGKARGA